MKDESKTKKQLINELLELRKRITELKKLEDKLMYDQKQAKKKN